MKANLKILAIAACLVISTCAQAQEGFIRPELSYNFAKISITGASGINLKNAVGYSVAGGACFGAQNEHELGVSIGTLDFSVSSNVAGVSISGKVKTVPVLANYRYYFGARADAVRFYLAPSLGYTNGKSDATVTTGTTIVRTSSSGNDFTWGAGLGILFKMADKVDMDVGYRYVEFKETDAKLKVGTLYAGVNFRF